MKNGPQPKYVRNKYWTYTNIEHSTPKQQQDIDHRIMMAMMTVDIIMKWNSWDAQCWYCLPPGANKSHFESCKLTFQVKLSSLLERREPLDGIGSKIAEKGRIKYDLTMIMSIGLSLMSTSQFSLTMQYTGIPRSLVDRMWPSIIELDDVRRRAAQMPAPLDGMIDLGILAEPGTPSLHHLGTLCTTHMSSL